MTTEQQCAYWTEVQVAERLNMSVKWLQKMRLAGGGIPYHKFGTKVRYGVADVLEFERESVRNSTSQSPSKTNGSKGGDA